MKLPSLKDIGSFIKKELSLGQKEPVMTFRVGEGLTPEQTITADTKLKELIKGGEGLPETKLSQEVAWNIQTSLLAKRKLGHTLSPTEIQAGDEASNAISEHIMGMVSGFMAPESGIIKGVVKKEVQPVIEKFINVLKEAKPIRKAQETLYSAERAGRIAKSVGVGKTTTGEAGFFAERGALKGELPKVEFESIRNKFKQANIDELFNRVKDNPILSPWEKITAREGLSKLFGEFGGKVPTEGEIGLLDNVFGKEFTDTLLSKRPLLDRIKDAAGQIANIPRSIMSSFDVSFGGRQGAFAAPTFRKQFFKSWIQQFKWFGSEKAYKLAQEEIARNPLFELAKESGVSFTNVGRIMSKREERFMSQWAEKIPIIGRGIAASSRAYTGFANKFRMDIFQSMAEDAIRIGIDPNKNRDLTKSIATFVNAATGRGELGIFERGAVGLNALFFSPRLMGSRLTLLNPVYYITQSPLVRKQALKSLFGFASAITTALTLAHLGGVEITTDPRSSDFAKIKIGNTRIDVAAGFQQYIRAAAQMITGKYVSSTTGKELTLGEGYKPITRFDILLRLIETKEAPVFSFITSLLRGQTFTGQDVSVPKEVGKRFVPMVIQDLIDLSGDDPKLLPIGLLGMFGFGVQTYESVMSKSEKTGLPSLKTGGGTIPSLKGVGKTK